MLNLVVLISGNGSNLQAIVDYLQLHPEVNATIRAVISNRPDAYGLQRAQKANIPAIVVDHTTFDSREAFDFQLLETIEGFAPDLLVFAGFMRILTPSFIEHFSNRMINIHPSLLPKFKGVNTHARAIAAKEVEHGCTVHVVTTELDSGAIIAQSMVPIEENDSAETLQQRVHTAEHRTYPQVIAWFAQKRLHFENNTLFFDNQPLPPQGVRIA